MHGRTTKREVENKTSVLLRYYRVFNVEQCDGLKALYGDDRKSVNPIAECESIGGAEVLRISNVCRMSP